jgi:MtaA/CmuA family methyltransferase
MSYTDLNRFHDTLNGQPKDRVPVFAGVSLWAAANYPEASFKEIALNPELICKAQMWARDQIGHDALYPMADPLFLPEAFGCEVRFSDTGPIVDPLSLSINSLEDIEKIDFPNPKETGRIPVMLDAARQLSQKSGGEIPLIGTFEGPFTNLCRVIEVEHILRMAFKNKSVLEALLDRMTEFLIEFAQAYIEQGVNALFIAEPTASSTMISPKMFRKYVLPRLQKLTHALGVPTILHICGDTNPIIDAMGEAGSDILSLDQCMDLSESRKRVPETVLAGNVDPVKSLLLGNIEMVKKDALNCLEMAGTHRFILLPGCAVPPTAPAKNLKAMVQTAVDYGLDGH